MPARVKLTTWLWGPPLGLHILSGRVGGKSYKAQPGRGPGAQPVARGWHEGSLILRGIETCLSLAMTGCTHPHTHCGDSLSIEDKPAAYPELNSGNRRSPGHPYLKEAWCHRTCCHCVVRGHGTHHRAGSCCALQERDTEGGTRATAGGQPACSQAGPEKGEAEGGSAVATPPDFCGSSSSQVAYVLVAGWPPSVASHPKPMQSVLAPRAPSLHLLHCR